MPSAAVRRPLAGARLALAPLLLLLGACAPGLTPIARPGPAPLPPATSAPVAAAAAAGSDADYLRERRLMVPVAGIAPERVADTFAAARGDRRHNALDIMAPRGTPVLAADDGHVLRVSSNALGGLTVYVLDLAERFIYYYAHLDAYRDGLRAGERLAQGAVLGYVGSTGNASASAPHLHFQAMRYRRDRHWDGVPVNPKPFLALPGLPVGVAAANEQQPQPSEPE